MGNRSAICPVSINGFASSVPGDSPAARGQVPVLPPCAPDEPGLQQYFSKRRKAGNGHVTPDAISRQVPARLSARSAPAALPSSAAWPRL